MFDILHLHVCIFVCVYIFTFAIANACKWVVLLACSK